MALTEVQKVRLRAADKSDLFREELTGDGVTKLFNLKYAPILAAPVPAVYLAGALQSTGYTLDLAYGVLTFTAAPTVNEEIWVDYYWSIFTDDEIQYFLDSASSDVTFAAAQVLLAIAADAAKIAKRQTIQGTDGTQVKDTTVAAQELRLTAKALMDEYNLTAGTQVPFDQLVEIPWTEQSFEEMWDQNFIRDN